jgi:hypothetical protein
MVSLLVLIIATEGDLFYNKCEESWRQRMKMFKELYSNSDVVKLDYYFLKCKETLENTQNDYEIIDDNFYILGKDSVYPGIFNKTCKAFEILSPKYDYTLRSNISSVFLIDRLIKWLENIPLQNIYAGYPEPFGNKHNPCWAFGAGYLVSRDVAENIVKNESVKCTNNIHDRYTIVDDVFVGELCLKILGYKLIPFDCFHITSNIPIQYIKDYILNHPSLFHIRIKLQDGTPRNPTEINIQTFLNETFISPLLN